MSAATRNPGKQRKVDPWSATATSKPAAAPRRNASRDTAVAMDMAREFSAGRISAQHIVRALRSNAKSVPAGEKHTYLLALRELADRLAQAVSEEQQEEKRDAGTNSDAFMSAFENESEARQKQRIDRGDLLGSAAMQAAMQFSRQALNRALKERRLFAVDGPSGTLLYPAFFADPKFDKRRLFEISKALGDLPGLSKLQFFTQAKQSVGNRTPLEAIEAGAVDAVLRAAHAFSER